MSRRKKEPLRALTETERSWLERIARSGSEPANHVIRAKQILAVGAGRNYTQAAREVGRKSGDAVGQLVARFNQKGIEAIETEAGSGAKRTYEEAVRAKILGEAQRKPSVAGDGVSSWSLQSLQKVLRREAGLERVSTFTIREVLREAGYSWTRSRSWCPTGQAVRRRKSGTVIVTDPDTEAKKN